MVANADIVGNNVSIFFNIPEEVVQRNATLFTSILPEFAILKIDNVIFKLYSMYDEETKLTVYYHPCNYTTLYDVLKQFTQKNFSIIDQERCYGS